MSVDRLTKGALQKILAGHVKEEATCIVKFYSNGCPYCHRLSASYKELAESEGYSDLHFFAFNITDYPEVEKVMGFDGVPTITLIKVGNNNPKIRVLQDPATPNKDTWYHINDINEFITKEKG